MSMTSDSSRREMAARVTDIHKHSADMMIVNQTQRSTTVFAPLRNTRCSMWYLTARASAAHSLSRPVLRNYSRRVKFS